MSIRGAIMVYALFFVFLVGMYFGIQSQRLNSRIHHKLNKISGVIKIAGYCLRERLRLWLKGCEEKMDIE